MGISGALAYFFWAILIIAFVVEAWAFFDVVRRPSGAFVAASKQTKKLWMIILGVALVVGMAYAASPLQGVNPVNALLSILPVAAFVASAVYLADVKPAVSQYRGGGSSGSGPYGPW